MNETIYYILYFEAVDQIFTSIEKRFDKNDLFYMVISMFHPENVESVEKVKWNRDDTNIRTENELFFSIFISRFNKCLWILVTIEKLFRNLLSI